MHSLPKGWDTEEFHLVKQLRVSSIINVGTSKTTPGFGWDEEEEASKQIAKFTVVKHIKKNIREHSFRGFHKKHFYLVFVQAIMKYYKHGIHIQFS